MRDQYFKAIEGFDLSVVEREALLAFYHVLHNDVEMGMNTEEDELKLMGVLEFLQACGKILWDEDHDGLHMLMMDIATGKMSKKGA